MEIWKEVEGYQNYRVSDLGRVQSIAYGTLMSSVSRKGYLRVYLSKDGTQKTKAVHILVAKAFLPNPENLPQVNHKDGDKQNNSIYNLEWATQISNMQHSAKLGLHGTGVHKSQTEGKWCASYSPEPYKRVYLGTFNSEKEALTARAAAIASINTVVIN